MPHSSTSLRCASWNVNGLRALARKKLLPWDQLPDCDLLCLQETKAHVDRLPVELAEPEGWHAFWHSAEKPGYSGVAVLSRERPDEVVEGLSEPDFDREGRVLGLRFGDLLVLSAYFPNSQDAGRRLPYKLAFCRAIERFLADWRARGCHVLLTGDYNIAPTAIDLARPAANEGNPGYLPEERDWFAHFLSLGYRDTFRDAHPEQEGAYSWWSYRTRARERNVGWRIDHCAVDPELIDRVRDPAIHPEILGSDHCPVSVVLR